MDKMFKRTLLGAAVATAAMTGSANAAIQLAGDAVQFYGQAAGNITLIDANDTQSVGADIESRIGFRGVVEFDDISPNFIWQMEGGNANNGDKTGGLGARDTYLGLDFEGVGQFKYGRQLVAAYNYVDWPHSNPGLGNVFDWNNDIGGGYQDRADSVLRFDSANFGGFNFQATLSGMTTDTDQMVSSVGASFTKGMFSVHGGYYHQGSYQGSVDEPEKFTTNANGDVILNPDWSAWDADGGSDSKQTIESRNYAIVGGSLFLGDFTLTAAYKAMEVGDVGQNAYSTTAQYVIDSKYVLKAGYAATDDADGTENTGDQAVTARFGYLLPSSYWYIDSRNYEFDGGDWAHRVLVGMEYYF
ncbi:outer membrane protein [Vibrio orientalis CIP 102891 = ATCC 33934]|uniref:Outer membrane porin protein n=1 Tax=Vibrio orientalis CIP 102891 = ATCC 33934 TaxID=675816 RepID=C9QM17_VIBOR|nr:porin [Vibrio orientalis]EEX93032.1 outer membrane porin protein [Vibrio orientalis CIP 102891 = ATCC 33934]EGU50651.1 outer membrane protein [Vibrio orientalis CIP 102891 = ATCC 33934]